MFRGGHLLILVVVVVVDFPPIDAEAEAVVAAGGGTAGRLLPPPRTGRATPCLDCIGERRFQAWRKAQVSQGGLSAALRGPAAGRTPPTVSRATENAVLELVKDAVRPGR
ncbi:MAG: hypothetical protein OXE17_01080 [Chloroflexi bacterium]|nr:hypothetical protein [Chloroflexota bacterium]